MQARERITQVLDSQLARYVAPLQESLVARADPKVKAWWEGYVKDSAPFLGIKMPVIRTLVHRWYRQHVAAPLDPEQQVDLALALIALAHTEEKLAGTLFLQEILLPAGALDWRRELDRFAVLFDSGAIADWNVCDWFCVKVLASLIKQEGEPCARHISSWHQAPVLWQARASLVPFTTVAGDPSYYPLIERSCWVLIRRQERFAKTAVGWILRDVSKHDVDFVRRVLDQNLAFFSAESLRNATKYFERVEQRDYLAKLKPHGA
jgi:3-methyladenine DNA glycosylase AlkD